MQLIVKYNKSYVIEVEHNISTKELKEIISDYLYIPSKNFYLTYGSKIMDKNYISNYNLTENSTIWLHVRSICNNCVTQRKY